MVRFEFHDPAARVVCLAGSFNDWDPRSHPMTAAPPGRWQAELPLPAGQYEYLFVVDGRWVADPGSPEPVPNPYGGLNSRRVVPRG